MLMARATKCPVCQLMFDRDKCEFVHHKNRYYHKVCYDNIMEKQQIDNKEQVDLENYIMEMFKTTCLSARVRKQIKQMREEYNYSYSGIHKSLIYFFEVKGNSIEKANGGIGIVPYIYQEAYTYYYNLHLAQERNKDKNVHDFVLTGKEIRIKSPIRKPKEKRLFNLEEE